ncbi:MAG: chromosome segregation protein SMC [Dermatophilaceae bacterium]
MYLKTVTLKGFKSFASATTLRLEPGITCIVGPNGSGKSNVADALAWVMGEQGAKSLRGGKMEDVIFSGTAGRAPLGRAEVTLTIDNSDGALPIDYHEVTVSRTMFRGGGSEYAINATPCRLLDVQELLSDSGIGREMHVVVGQGQLDAVLRASPEERRGLIEEAAGVLKHRKRKERALRKLDAMQANLTRVQDLTGEIRRQLGPLGRQAETARRAALIQAEVRDARLRIVADDLVALTATLEQESADESALLSRRAQVEQALHDGQVRLSTLEDEAEHDRPQLQQAQHRWFTLTRLEERLGATARLAAERVRLLSEEDTDGSDAAAGPVLAPARDPELMRGQAAELRAQHRELLGQVEHCRQALQRASAERAEAESRYAEQQQRLAQLTRAAADRREGLATLAGQVAAKASRVEAAEAELGRLRQAQAQAKARGAAAQQQFAALEASIAVDEEGEESLDADHESAVRALDQARGALAVLLEQELTADRDRQTATAKAQALQLSLERKDGAAALLAGEVGEHGVVGAIAALVTVADGCEAAVSGALGWAADAVVVDSLDAALAGLAALREGQAGRAGMVVSARSMGAPVRPPPPEGARWVSDLVECAPPLWSALDRLLAGSVLVADDAAAARLLAYHPDLTAVTRSGDVLSAGAVRGGSATAPSLIEVRSALAEAQQAAQDATQRLERARFAASASRERIAAASRRVEHTLERLHDSDARLAAVAEELGHFGAALRAAHSEAQRAEQAIATVTTGLAADRDAHAALAARLEAASASEPAEQEPSTQQRDECDALAGQARARETEARLTLRTQEERARALDERAVALQAAAEAEETARRRRSLRRERRRREAAVAAAVRVAAEDGAARMREAGERAQALLRAAEQERDIREQLLTSVRRQLAQHQDELRELTDSVHRDEVARAEQRLRIEALHARARDELGMDPVTLIDEYGPHLRVPVLRDASEAGAQQGELESVPFVRDAQERRLRAAERRLSALGRVNPLALEEFAALEERHAFLVTQLDDLSRSKRDLLDIVKEVDERVEQAFAEAFYDTARQFERVFPRLFPGGEGRLVLTDPTDMLTTGLEVEARPAGKKVRRLSLLSGGERSLVAVALLVAIFKARPSPFYILDEVEAALDDANLARLLILFEELRDSSQLIVITHQKRTMETADALYGVGMRGDGVTTVVGQRMRDVAQPA